MKRPGTSWLLLLGLCGLTAAGSAPASDLPPLAELVEHTRPGEHVVVHELAFSGNRVIAQRVLHAVARPYLDRPLFAEDLVRLQHELTALYVQRGYVSSRALLEPQDLRDGRLEVRIVEGRIGDVEVRGPSRLRPGHLRRQLLGSGGGPLNVRELEESLRLLQADPHVRSVRAELVPGQIQGESRLVLEVSEESPLSIGLSAGNGWSPAIGETGGELLVGYANALGIGDVLRIGVTATAGLDSIDAGYALPITPWGTRLSVQLRRSRADVVETPLDELDIESASTAWRVGLAQPLLRRADRELWLRLDAETRRSRTRLLGRRFSFSNGARDGQIRVTTVAFGQEWIARSRSRVLAALSSFRFGLDALDATDGGAGSGAVPDATFAYWLGQFQWVQRLPAGWWASQLMLRADVQLSLDPLFPSEQLALGGPRTVRGYRRNRLVRDSGAALSAELRIPLLRSGLGHELLQLAPFVDLGHGRDHRDTAGPRTLSSIGVGLHYRPTPRLSLSLQWAHRLRRGLERPGDGLQDHGLHLETTWLAF